MSSPIGPGRARHRQIEGLPKDLPMPERMQPGRSSSGALKACRVLGSILPGRLPVPIGGNRPTNLRRPASGAAVGDCSKAGSPRGTGGFVAFMRLLEH